MQKHTARRAGGFISPVPPIARTLDPLVALGERVVVMGDCYVVDGDTDVYAHAGGMNAHRFVWESIHGPIGCDDHIHHVCRTKGCINPDHLQRLTRREHCDAHADD